MLPNKPRGNPRVDAYSQRHLLWQRGVHQPAIAGAELLCMGLFCEKAAAARLAMSGGGVSGRRESGHCSTDAHLGTPVLPGEGQRIPWSFVSP